MGSKSGRNGAPAPKSRVSVSDSKPEVEFYLLDCVRSFLLVLSGFAVDLSALLCTLAYLFARLREPQHFHVFFGTHGRAKIFARD